MSFSVTADPRYGRAGQREAQRLQAMAERRNLAERASGYGFQPVTAENKFSLFKDNPDVTDGKFHHALGDAPEPEAQVIVVPASKASSYGFEKAPTASKALKADAAASTSADDEELMYRSKYGKSKAELLAEQRNPETRVEKTPTPGGMFTEPGNTKPTRHGLTTKDGFTPQPSIAREVSAPSAALESFEKNPMTLKMIQERAKGDQKKETDEQKRASAGAKQRSAAIEWAKSFAVGRVDSEGKPITRNRIQRGLAEKYKGVEFDQEFEDILRLHDPEVPAGSSEPGWKKVWEKAKQRVGDAVAGRKPAPAVQETPTFNSVQEAEDSGLPVGTKIQVWDGKSWRSARVK